MATRSGTGSEMPYLPCTGRQTLQAAIRAPLRASPLARPGCHGRWILTAMSEGTQRGTIEHLRPTGAFLTSSPPDRLAPVFAAAIRVPRPLTAHLTLPRLVYDKVIRPLPTFPTVRFPITRALPPLRRKGESPLTPIAPALVRVTNTQGAQQHAQTASDPPTPHVTPLLST
jgi:hypothetical protein